MVRPKLRSRSYRRIYVKLPSGITTVHYEKRKDNIAKCAICGKFLHGVKSDNKFSKTEKRPERIYGGTLCHECLENLIKRTVRGII